MKTHSWMVVTLLTFSVQAGADFNDPAFGVLANDPQKKNRACACQFGIDIPLTEYFPIPIGEIMTPGRYSEHNYGSPASTEPNGQLYSCRGGFLDSTHFRAAADWTAHMILQFEKIYSSGEWVTVRPEGGPMKFRFIPRSEIPTLDLEDRILLAQRISYERLTWHELMSWYFHAPAALFPESQSAFSPEDPYSNLIGTYMGAEAVRKMIRSPGLSYSNAMDQAVLEVLTHLEVVQTRTQVRDAFYQVDRKKQKFPEHALNDRIWYDSRVPLLDQRYIFKRAAPKSLNERVDPWLVPYPLEIGCAARPEPVPLDVPVTTRDGSVQLASLYEFTLKPERKYFEPAGHAEWPEKVRSSDVDRLLRLVRREMESLLGKNFDSPTRENFPRP